MLLLLVALIAQASPKVVDWESMIPTIRSEVRDEFKGVKDVRPIDIRKTEDITGDGRPEALVYLGLGGASTDLSAVMRMEYDRPVAALFRQRDGTVSTMTFLEGASAMHGDEIDLLVQEQAISATHYKMDSSGKRFESCGAEVYKWNTETKTFNYNPRLSERVGRDYCRKVAQHTQ